MEAAPLPEYVSCDVRQMRGSQAHGRWEPTSVAQREMLLLRYLLAG